MTNNESKLCDKAKKALEIKDYAKSIKLFKKHLKHFPDDEAAWYDLGISYLRSDHQSMKMASKAEACFRKRITLNPSDFISYYQLGIALTIQTRKEEALSALQKSVDLNAMFARGHYELSKIQFALGVEKDAYCNLVRSVELDPSFEPAISGLKELEAEPKSKSESIRFKRFPNLISMMEDLPKFIDHYLAREKMPKILTDESVVTTFGSCFAGNIAKTLRSLGVNAKNITFGESINSPQANKAYIQWALEEDGGGGAAAVTIAAIHQNDPNFPKTPKEHRNRIMDTDILILTIGVASIFVNKDSHELVIPRQVFSLRPILNSCYYKMTSVNENLECIHYVIKKIKKINPRVKIIITLSPVPMNCTFEYDSAIEADCVSKSILRVTIDELLRKGIPDLYYWPAFEIVKWLGPYLGNTYGDEDGSTIHVSDDIINAIMMSFIKWCK